MHETGKQLLKLMFRPGESICVSHNKYGYHSLPLEEVLGNDEITLIPTEESCKKRNLEFIPENYDRVKTDNLLMVALNPINGYRIDKNCVAYRSFLVELDIGTIPQQINTLNHIKLPFSAQIFSGNKSVHTLITLSEDIPTEKQYRFVAQWILNIIKLADQNIQNPSRSIRIPGPYREPGKQQTLIEIRDKVDTQVFMEWLNKYEKLKPEIKIPRKISGTKANFDRLSPWAQSILKKGPKFGKGRNIGYFSLAVDFAIAGYNQDQAIDVLNRIYTEEDDFREKEFLAAIASGYKYAEENKD